MKPIRAIALSTVVAAALLAAAAPPAAAGCAETDCTSATSDYLNTVSAHGVRHGSDLAAHFTLLAFGVVAAAPGLERCASTVALDPTVGGAASCQRGVVALLTAASAGFTGPASRAALELAIAATDATATFAPALLP